MLCNGKFSNSHRSFLFEQLRSIIVLVKGIQISIIKLKKDKQQSIKSKSKKEKQLS